MTSLELISPLSTLLLMAHHFDSLIQFLLHSTFPFISLHIFPYLKKLFFSLAETSMDQDVYGAYNKQRIESLTTDGEGES